MADPVTSRGDVESGGTVTAKYARLAADYDRRWARYIEATTRETLLRAAIRPNERVLDVGCGTGALLAALAGAGHQGAVVGVDLTLGMLRVARERLGPAARLAVADAVALPIRDAAFDVVLSCSSLHDWPDPTRALAAIRRGMAVGGRLVLTTWCHDFLSCRVCEVVLNWFGGERNRSYRSDECVALIERAGLRVEALDKYKISWLWGLMTVTARAR